MPKYTEIMMRAYYDDETGKIQLITKDKRMRGKPFQMTLSRDSESAESLFNLLEDENVVTKQAVINKLPKEVFFDNSVNSKNFVKEGHDYINNPDHEDPRLIFSIGEDSDGNVRKIDLKHAPATLITGRCGSGKTQFLRNIAQQVIRFPDNQLFVISRSSEFDDLHLRNGLDHIEKGLDGAFKMCQDVERIFKDRMKILEQNFVNRWMDDDEIDPIFFMIDEAAHFLFPSGVKTNDGRLDDLKSSYCSEILNRVSMQGQTVGIYLFYSTQRPDATILPGETKANLGRRILMGKSESVVEQMTLHKKSDISNMLKENPGRGIIRTYGSEEVLFQAYHVPYQKNS